MFCCKFWEQDPLLCQTFNYVCGKLNTISLKKNPPTSVTKQQVADYQCARTCWASCSSSFWAGTLCRQWALESKHTSTWMPEHPCLESKASDSKCHIWLLLWSGATWPCVRSYERHVRNISDSYPAVLFEIAKSCHSWKRLSSPSEILPLLKRWLLCNYTDMGMCLILPSDWNAVIGAIFQTSLLDEYSANG